MFYVYGHYKNSDNKLFYIGVAKLKSRLKSKKNRNKFWENVVNKHGFYYKILFEYDNIEDCFKKEKELISIYGRIDLGTGFLVNLTDGGEGINNLSLEAKKRISDSMKKRVVSDITKEKMKLAHIGKKLSDETKNKLSISQKNKDHSYKIGMKKSKECIEKLAKSKTGVSVGRFRNFTFEQKKKISKSNTTVCIKENIDYCLTEIKKGRFIKDIAKDINCSRATIIQYFIKNNYCWVYIGENLKTGEKYESDNYKNILNFYNISYYSFKNFIKNKISKNDLIFYKEFKIFKKHKPPMKMTIINSNNKLSDLDKLNIIKLYQEKKYIQRELASIYNVKTCTINQIINNKL